MIIRYSKEKIILFILLFFWFFSPVINILGIIEFKTYVLTVILPAVLGLISYFKYKQQSKLSNLTLVLMLYGFIYVLVAENIGLLKGIVDFSFTKDQIIGFAIFFSAYYIVQQYKENYNESFRQKLLLHIFYVGVIHSVVILLLVIFPDFKELFYKFFWITEKQSRYIFGEVFNRRYSGFLDTGFASLSAIHATMLAIGLYYLYEFKNEVNSKVIFIFLSFIVFSSLIFIGRSGFVVLGLYTFLLQFAYVVYILKNRKISSSLFKYLIVFIIGIGLVIWLVDLSKYEAEINSSFELFINFIETGSFSTYSTDIILDNQLIFPLEPFELFFGSANFGRGSDVIPSDLGMVYFVNGIGIFGTVIVFLFHFILLYYAYVFRKSYTIMFYFIVVFEILLIILNFKDLYFLAFSGITKIFFIYVFIYHFISLDLKNNREVKR